MQIFTDDLRENKGMPQKTSHFVGEPGNWLPSPEMVKQLIDFRNKNGQTSMYSVYRYTDLETIDRIKKTCRQTRYHTS